MSGSGLIYAAVLGAWAVYFVSRSIRFGPREVLVPPQGTVLRRRGSTQVPAGSYAMLRPAAEEPAEPVVKPRRSDVAVQPAPVSVPVSASTARRRRFMLTLLILSTVVPGVLAGVGVLAGWIVGVPGLLLLTYLVELRASVRRARRACSAAALESVEGGARRTLRWARHRQTEEVWEDPWPCFDIPDASAGRQSDLVGGWEPRPVPLPTYLSSTSTSSPGAPQAAGSRRIDTSGSVWTAVAEARSSRPESAGEVSVRTVVNLTKATPSPDETAAVADTTVAAELEVEFEQKRAVND